MKRSFTLSLAALLLSSTTAFASPLNYTPVNPSFGGSPLNGSYLLSMAQAQNHFKERQTPASTQSPEDALGDQITSSIRSQVSARIAQDIHNADPTDPDSQNGYYTVGNSSIEWHIVGSEVVITILNPSRGAVTYNFPVF